MSKEMADPLTSFLLRWPTGVDGRTLLVSAGRFQAVALQAMLRYQVEMLTFMKSRSEHNLRLWEDLLAADYARDGFDLYCGFWRDILLDYSDGAGRMTHVASQIAVQTAQCIDEEQQVLTEEVATPMVM